MTGKQYARLRLLRRAIVVGGRANRHHIRRERDHGRIAKVFRNIYVNPRALVCDDFWEFRLRVMLLRAIAVSMALGPNCPLIRESAALLYGVEQSVTNWDIHVRVPRGRRRNPWRLEAIHIAGRPVIAAAQVLRHERALPRGCLEHPVADVTVVSLEVATVQAAHELDPCQGVVVSSGCLRRLAEFTHFEQETGRAREKLWRKLLAEQIDALPYRPGRPKARAVLKAADAGCESVQERVLLWILKAAGFADVHTQVEHVVHGRSLFTDFEVERGAAAVEFDGKGKYGEERQEILESLTHRDQRQKLLEHIGMLVLRFESFELKNPTRVVEEIRARTRCRRRRPVRLLVV